jgi:probable F420-dependent oxidoreductase
MELGMVVRNMGAVATRSVIRAVALHAQSVGIEQLWVTDHIAIPPEDSEGSGGCYLDPLATLAFLAGITDQIRLGVGVLVLPYRPALPTAKWVASIQELSEGRLTLGAGVGWMPGEFRAAGVNRSRRGQITDETLAFINACFKADEMESNGQKFLFLPRPARPPVLIGGAPEHAIPRIVAHGDGWMPGRLEPEELAPHVRHLKEAMANAGRAEPVVTMLTHLPLDDGAAARERLTAFEEAGATGVAHFTRYENVDEFKTAADALAGLQ